MPGRRRALMGSSMERAKARIGDFEFDPATEDGRRVGETRTPRRVSTHVEEGLGGVVDELSQLNDSTFRRRGRLVLPSRSVVASLIEDLRAVLYPVHFGAEHELGRS